MHQSHSRSKKQNHYCPKMVECSKGLRQGLVEDLFALFQNISFHIKIQPHKNLLDTISTSHTLCMHFIKNHSWSDQGNWYLNSRPNVTSKVFPNFNNMLHHCRLGTTEKSGADVLKLFFSQQFLAYEHSEEVFCVIFSPPPFPQFQFISMS